MSEAFEFEIDGRAYKVRSMDCFAQLAILAKVSPLLASGFGEIVAFVVAMRKEGIANLGNVPMERAAALLPPVARELAKMSDQDRREVIGACLDVVERKTDVGQGWAKIWNVAAGRAMFDDINNDLLLTLRIALNVFQGTFRRFFPESLSKFLAGENG